MILARKKYLIMIAFVIVMTVTLINIIVVHVFEKDWFDNSFLILRILCELGFAVCYVIIFNYLTRNLETNNPLITQMKAYIRCQNAILLITLTLCLFDCIYFEIESPMKNSSSINIAAAGCIAQCLNLLLRKEFSKQKKLIIMLILTALIFVLLSGVIYKLTNI